jgi:hypothetical protein
MAAKKPKPRKPPNTSPDVPDVANVIVDDDFDEDFDACEECGHVREVHAPDGCSEYLANGSACSCEGFTALNPFANPFRDPKGGQPPAQTITTDNTDVQFDPATNRPQYSFAGNETIPETVKRRVEEVLETVLDRVSDEELLRYIPGACARIDKWPTRPPRQPDGLCSSCWEIDCSCQSSAAEWTLGCWHITDPARGIGRFETLDSAVVDHFIGPITLAVQKALEETMVYVSERE